MPVPEDRFTNSIEGAAAYERYRARESGEFDQDDYDGPRRPLRMPRCRCLGGAHGPDCPMLDYHPEEDPRHGLEDREAPQVTPPPPPPAPESQEADDELPF